MRRGFALFLSILAVVIVGALIVAVHVSVAADSSVAAGAPLRQRAFAVAEYALWSAIGSWDTSSHSLQPGASSATTVRAGRDTAVLRITRLTDSIFWLKSTATVGPPQRAATRATGASVRLSLDSAGKPLVRPLPRYGWVGIL